MVGYKTLNERYTDWTEYNYNKKTFRVLKPIQMFLDFFKYEETPIEWDSKDIVIIGPKNSGKTVLIRYLVYLVRSNPDFKRLISVFRTNDLRIVGDTRYSHLFKKKKVLVMIIDDAMTAGIDSRRAMSHENVDMTQEFEIVRHTLEENYEPNGIIFTIFASQIYSRVDPTIRDNAQLKIFTAYYDQPWYKAIFTPDEAEWMRINTYDGMFASNFKARRFALARTNTGDVVTLEIPFSRREDVPYPNIVRTVNKEFIRTKLTRILIRKLSGPGKNLNTYNKSELKEFLKLHSQKIKTRLNVKLKDSDYVSSINRASFILKKFESLNYIPQEEFTINLDPNKKLTILERVLNALNQEKISNIETISLISRVDNLGLVRRALSDNPNLFENAVRGRGIWALKGYNYTQFEIDQLTGDKPLKKLVMEEESS